MCASTKYIDGVNSSAVKIFAPLTSALTKKLLAPSASIAKKNFNTGTNIFIKIILTKKLAAITLF